MQFRPSTIITLALVLCNASRYLCLSPPIWSTANGFMEFHANYPDDEARAHGKRSVEADISICGFETGDPNKPRTAPSGYHCLADVENSLWESCSTTATEASDCGIAAICFDEDDCSDGCGTSVGGFTGLVCRNGFCSTALMTFGIDETFTNIACGTTAVTDHYHFRPTALEDSSTAGPDSSSRNVGTAPTPTPESSSSLPSGSGSGSDVDAAASTREDESTVEAPEASSSAEESGQVEQQEEGQDDSGSSDTSVPVGAIVGGVIGGLAIICGSVVAVVFLLRRNLNKRKASVGDGPGEPSHQAATSWGQQGTKSQGDVYGPESGSGHGGGNRTSELPG